MPESTQRWLFPLVAVAIGAVLFLPGIGTFGLWDPHEIKIADQAREVYRHAQQSGFDVTVGGKFPQRPPLAMWLMARSLGSLGLSETAARLPFAGMALLGLLVVYALGASLFSRKAGLIAAVALASAPGYILQARQVVSDVFLVVPSATAFLGLTMLLWPRAGQHSAKSLGAGITLSLVGLGLGYLAGGALLGVVIPLGAVVLSGVLAYSYTVETPAEGSGTLACAGIGPAFPAGGRVFSGYALHLAIMGALLVGIAGFTIEQVVAATRYSPLVGAVPGKAAGGLTWDYFLKQVGFAFFPMSALAPFAFGRFLFDQSPTGGRPAFARLLVTTWGLLAFFVASLYVWRYGDLRFPALPALALAVGVLVAELLDRPSTGEEALMGFGVALVAAVFARDLFLYPEYVATNHLLDTVKWPTGPTGLNVGPLFVAYGLAFAACAFGAYALRHRIPRAAALGGLGMVGVAIVSAATISFVVTPGLSKHYSQKVLFDQFQKLRKSGESLAQYKVPGRGVSYYTRGEVQDLTTMPALLDYLRQPKRVFVVTAAEELGQLDTSARAGTVSYFVIDDTSSRFLLVSNQLGPGEQDKNALKLLVRQVPPTVQHPVAADFEGKVALVGYDLPAELSRGSKFTIKLHFQVKEKPAGGYKIFLHFDGPGTRFNGDHTPLDGKFPTSLWSAGDYITDPFEMMAERATTPKGTYTVYMGFWPGGDGKRFKVRSGPSDGTDRVKLGTVVIN